MCLGRAYPFTFEAPDSTLLLTREVGVLIDARFLQTGTKLSFNAMH